ncbi:MAG: hypothetical protein AAGJ79_08430, partial [Verrucomicrobiota bacterium]
MKIPSLTVLLALSPFGFLHATTFTFNTDSRTVASSSTGGTVTSVRGSSFTTNLAADGVSEFIFSGALNFFSSDDVNVSGSRPARWIVSGDVSLPTGATIRVDAG